MNRFASVGIVLGVVLVVGIVTVPPSLAQSEGPSAGGSTPPTDLSAAPVAEASRSGSSVSPGSVAGFARFGP